MTKPVYEVIENANGTQSIQRSDADGKVCSIPFDEGNSDYQAYLKRDEAETIQSCQSVKGTGR